MKHTEEEYGDFTKLGPIIEELLKKLNEHNLNNGEVIDVIAGLLGFELFKAYRKFGAGSVRAIMNRFLDRVSIAVPGTWQFMSMNDSGDKN